MECIEFLSYEWYFQEETSSVSVKRFKPSPLSSEEDNSSSSSGLKIRLSRYPQAKEGREGVTVKSCEVRVGSLPHLDTQTDSQPRADSKPSLTYNITPNMTSSEIIQECERVGPGQGPISTSILANQEVTPRPRRRHELPKLSPEQLLPPTPSVHVKNKQEAFSPQLLEWCLQRPITVIRGIAQACDIDLSLYTTKTLAQTNPNHPVEIRTQLEQNSDENWDPSLSQEVSTDLPTSGGFLLTVR